ncbi:SigE-dependent sporulation protein [Robertmurraya yapensis]|uniref:SigE-dependent sporulation protein n=2 Tax=Bacillaceae TaxID=186817 RepID=A0A431W7E6_9BACI|nr:sporulation YhaL family protein [Bacillus yapensis]RTR31419.1 SigE-dependent sporulation protein [Bacillus yapensis]TKS95643.1 SigE-dependent sporulation protein [Bacillus yapensis]
MDIPVWILLLVGGIIISAFMAVKVGREEKEEERELIEKEGEVYMERLKKEKEERSEGRSFG